MLDDAAITEFEQQARRFSGAFTGTSGSLAAAVLLLIKDRKALMTELELANQAIRDAVTERMATTAADDPKLVGYKPSAESCCDGGKCHTVDGGKRISTDSVIPEDWILRGQRELEEQRQRGDAIIEATPDGLRPGSREFLAVLDELRDLHLKKTLDYGVDEDALSNIRSSADVVNMQAWAGCVLRMMDKMHRLKAFFRRGRVEFDGLSDTLKDIACYAVIAEVLRREDDRQTPSG